ncbi:YwmB family TATA-box binding protein [Metabacillus malikii]|uniref:YwmB family TATA-box binding protein n=1 Tax=Metabacillus malikii TaxID=1504265 RepID=A0ABT9ZJR1_9BACI|nr:YwmB family TATA-box binding protein [Metabacillus malikii]MDQ0232114.1 hypothetical protein [Metabacillus malikii]
MKKREIAVFALSIILLLTIAVNHIGATGNDTKILQLIEGMQKQNIKINEWSLYTKSNVEKKTAEEMKLFADQYRHYNWTFEEGDDFDKAVGVYQNKEHKITEKLQIISTHKNQIEDTYILYEVNGVGMRSNMAEMNEYFQNQAFDIFREYPTTFACVNGTVDDMMKVGLHEINEELLKQFDAHAIERLEEDEFLSISAKTTMWEDFIPALNDEMNLQIALRTDGLGDSTTVVIGTPIITSEY